MRASTCTCTSSSLLTSLALCTAFSRSRATGGMPAVWALRPGAPPLAAPPTGGRTAGAGTGAGGNGSTIWWRGTCGP